MLEKICQMAVGSEIESIDQEMELLSKEMERLISECQPFVGSRPMPEEYYGVQKKFNELRQRKNDLLDRLADQKRKAGMAAAESRVFVNSDGEATKRYITTSTYERAQRRAQKAVMRNMGIKDVSGN